MLATKDLFNQLDDLFESINSSPETTYTKSTTNESTNSTDIDEIYDDHKSIETNNTSIYDIHEKNDVKSKMLNNNYNNDNLMIILDCLEDMIIQESNQIENELKYLISDLSNLKSYNTYNIPMKLNFSNNSKKKNLILNEYKRSSINYSIRNSIISDDYSLRSFSLTKSK